jgi:hypothetical protein
MIEKMEAQVRATWYATARAAGVNKRDCEGISSAFAYPGFRRRQQAQGTWSHSPGSENRARSASSRTPRFKAI